MKNMFPLFIYMFVFVAPQWTSVDLVNSYRASCKKHNTKPLISVLNQLQVSTKHINSSPNTMQVNNQFSKFKVLWGFKSRTDGQFYFSE